MTGLLDGMRVLDLGLWRPTGHATSVLCALGAEVLMVEPPGGTPMRAYPEIFAGLARGKRSVEIDARTPEGRDRVLDLAAQADVVVEGWRPGVADRLGVGVDALRLQNPSLITCSISGYGQTGPWRDVPGHDLAFQALAGAVAPRPHGEDPKPRIPRLPTADLEAGTFAATLVCAAWARRLTTGEGEHIDVAMADVVAWWVGPSSTTRVAGVAGPVYGSPGYGVYRAADGRWLALAPLGEPRLWRAICEALALSDLADLRLDELYRRVGEVDARIAAAVGALTGEDALDRLLAAGAPVAPVLTPEEAVRHPQLAARGIVEEAGGETVVAVPAVLERHPRRPPSAVPTVGAHDGFSPRR